MSYWLISVVPNMRKLTIVQTIPKAKRQKSYKIVFREMVILLQRDKVNAKSALFAEKSQKCKLLGIFGRIYLESINFIAKMESDFSLAKWSQGMGISDLSLHLSTYIERGSIPRPEDLHHYNAWSQITHCRMPSLTKVFYFGHFLHSQKKNYGWRKAGIKFHKTYWINDGLSLRALSYFCISVPNLFCILQGILYVFLSQETTV